MKVYVDKNRCIGCALCVGLEPSVFEMNEEGFASAIKEAEYEKVCENITQAMEMCLAGAIEEE